MTRHPPSENTHTQPTSAKKPLRPKTIAQFNAMYRGETHIRPIVLEHPKTGVLHRLTPTDTQSPSYGTVDAPVSKARYEPIPVKPINISFYEFREEQLKKAKQQSLIMPEGCHIEAFRLHAADLRKDEKLISKPKLFALIEAIGTDSRWWPLQDPDYDSKKVFEHARVNILFRGEKPLGTIIWDDSQLKHDGSAKWILVGLRPEERNHQYGSFLMRWQMKTLAEQGAKTLLLYTGDADFVTGKDGKRVPASHYYESLKAVHVGSARWDPHTYEANKPHILELDHSMFYIPESFFRSPDGASQLGRFTQQELNRRLDAAFAVKMLHPAT